MENLQIKQLSGGAGVFRPRALKGGNMESAQIKQFISSRPGARPRGRTTNAPRGRTTNAPGGRTKTAPGGRTKTAPRGRTKTAPGGWTKTAPGGRRATAPGGWPATAPGGRTGFFSRGAEAEARAVSSLSGRAGGSPRPVRHFAAAAAGGQSAPFRKKSQKGFLMVMLLPLLALMMAGIAGFSLLSLGIKNFSAAQKTCILTGLAGQRELKAVLERLLALNKTAVSLHVKRQALQRAFEAAAAVGFFHAAAALRQKIMAVKMKQKALTARQRWLLRSGALAKKKTLQKLRRLLRRKVKAKNIRENTAYKKALAVLRKKLGPHAETYRPMPDFPNRQKTVFSWDMRLFFPILQVEDFGQAEIQRPARYSCAATLEKRGGIWQTRLSQPAPAGFFGRAK